MSQVSLAWERAAIDGDYPVIKSFVYLGKKGYTDNVLKLLVTNGHFKILNFLWGYQDFKFKSSMKLPILACENGHLDILKFLMLNCPEMSLKNTVEAASANGHFEIVKFLANRVEWGYNAVDFAAKNGHLDILKFLLNIKRYYSENMVNFAAMNGHVEIIKFIYEHHDFPGNSLAIDYAAYYGHLGIIKYLHSKGLHGTNLAISNAAENNHFDVVKYLIDRGYLPLKNLFSDAVKSRNLEMIKYLHEKNITNEFAMVEAIRINDIHIVKYLHENTRQILCGFELLEAITFGYYDIVEYLVNNFEEKIKNMLSLCIETVFMFGDFKMLKLFSKFLINQDSLDGFEETSLYKNSEMSKFVDFLRNVKYIDTDEACSICIDTGKKSVKTKCGHVFHHECLTVWYIKEGTCPLCRKALS